MNKVYMLVCKILSEALTPLAARYLAKRVNDPKMGQFARKKLMIGGAAKAAPQAIQKLY